MCLKGHYGRSLMYRLQLLKLERLFHTYPFEQAQVPRLQVIQYLRWGASVGEISLKIEVNEVTKLFPSNCIVDHMRASRPWKVTPYSPLQVLFKMVPLGGTTLIKAPSNYELPGGSKAA